MKKPRYLVPWRSYLAVASIFGLLYLAVSEHRELRCLYVVLIMGVFWVTEALPLPITAVLPVPLYPMLGILSSEDVCFEYLKSTNMMMLGGLMAAVAIEHSGLHYRIALLTTLLIGTSPMKIMCGLMVSTWVMSMWISNSAAAALMAPIATAVVAALKEGRRNIEDEVPTAADGGEETTESTRPDRETVGYYISIAYAANIGGIGTLVGSPPNLVLRDIYEAEFHDKDTVNFGSWMGFNTPYAFVALFCTLIFLQFFFMGLFRKKTPDQIKNFENSKLVRGILSEKYKELGSISWHESVVLALFIVLVLLWVFRSPSLFEGWSFLFLLNVHDASPAMMIVVIFFIIPAQLTFFRCSEPYEKGAMSVLTWSVLHKKTSWDVMLLMGGSFAMSKGMKASGLSDATGKLFLPMQQVPPPVFLMITCVLTVIMTTFSSNTAVANIILPVLATLSQEMGIHPLYFMMPTTISCSLAFMLPASTPPNAIILEAGRLKSTDMIKAGFPVTIICLLVLLVMFLSFAAFIYDFGHLPKS